jgi:hypothetical protein
MDMRAALLAVLLVLLASAAAARPVAIPDQPVQLRLPTWERMAAAQRNTQSDFAPMDSSAPAAPSSGLSFGPLHAETVSDARPGRRRAILQYRLDGMQVMGGEVGGSLGGHGAMLSLHWPSGQ